jgi:hypothetical protein
MLVMDDHTPPLRWPLAIVTAVHPGRDQRIRVVTVKKFKGNIPMPNYKILFIAFPKFYVISHWLGRTVR